MVKFRAKNVWWNHRIRCAALVGLTSISLLGSESREGFAEWFPKAKAPKQSEFQEPPANSSFDDAIRKLLKEAKSAEKKGEIDRAIILAERAAKISESSSEIVKAASDVSPAATARYAHDLRLRKVELASKPPAGSASNGPPLVASRSSKKSAATKEGLSPARRANPVIAGPTATHTSDERIAANVTAPRSQTKSEARRQLPPKQDSNLPDIDLVTESRTTNIRATKPIEPQVEIETAVRTEQPTGTQDIVGSTTELASTTAQDKTPFTVAAIPENPSNENMTLGTGKNWEAVTSSTVTPISSSALAGEDVSDSFDTGDLVNGTAPVHTVDIRKFKDIRQLDDLGANFQSPLATTRTPAAPVAPIETLDVTRNSETIESVGAVENNGSAVASEEKNSQPLAEIREAIASTESFDQKSFAPQVGTPQVPDTDGPEPAKTETPPPTLKLRRQFRETDLSKDMPTFATKDARSNAEVASIVEEHRAPLVSQGQIESKSQHDHSPSVHVSSSNDWDNADAVKSPQSPGDAKSTALADIVTPSQPHGAASFKLRPSFRDRSVTTLTPNARTVVPVSGHQSEETNPTVIRADLRQTQGDSAPGTGGIPDSSTEMPQNPRPSFRLRPSFGKGAKPATADLVAIAQVTNITPTNTPAKSLKETTVAAVVLADNSPTESAVEPSFQAPLPPGLESAKLDPMSATDRKKPDKVSKSAGDRTKVETLSQRSSTSPTDLVGSIQRSRKARPIVSEDDHAASTRAILSSGPIQRLAKLAGIPKSTASAMFVVFGITLLMAGLWMIRTTAGIKQT